MKSHMKTAVQHDILATHRNQNTTPTNILASTYPSRRYQREQFNHEAYPVVEYEYQTSANEQEKSLILLFIVSKANETIAEIQR